MHNAIRYLDDEMGGDEFPEDLENLRRPMAKALADYVPDTHIILNGQESDYGGVAGKDSIHGSGDKAHIAVGQGSLIRVMRGISDDAPSYSLLHESERTYRRGTCRCTGLRGQRDPRGQLGLEPPEPAGRHGDGGHQRNRRRCLPGQGR